MTVLGWTTATFLTCFVLGYEIGTRAGIALHASVPDYHTSGAWTCVAIAALGARLMGLDLARRRATHWGSPSTMVRAAR